MEESRKNGAPKNRQQNNKNNRNNGNNKFRNNNNNNHHNKPKYQPFKQKTATWKIIDDEVKELVSKYEQLDPTKITNFTDFPLSQRTLAGLKMSHYIKPTEIQREAICLALNGLDVLGAAKTGSGKTLAFLIPILESLHRHKWAKLDGLGALIISPTRELAYQTFEVLKKIGLKHDFSAGLVIGGKDLKFECDLITKTNIIVCTPGRLLQHMDETWNFNCDNLKILVLDEADRILDLGFAQTLNSIIANLPPRQTLLFSATQTKSISSLARLSLKNPTYVSVHENASTSTPDLLEQNYVVCEQHDKMNFLWSFIKNHTKSKVICFLQSCKQVKYVYEVFSKLGAGCHLLSLYGTMNQLRRMNIYDEFCRKQHSILFATDIASRGLDFPNVNWVIQMDCPVDANTYIHRVGRTARFERNGQALLVLTPSEKDFMLSELERKKIEIKEINVNKSYLVSIEPKLQSLCAQDVELKESAKRSLVAYIKSLVLIKNKKLFNAETIDLPKFSASLGLTITPRIRLLKKSNTKETSLATAKADESQEEEEREDDAQLNDEVSDDDLFTVKRVHNSQSSDDGGDNDGLTEEQSKHKKIKIITKASIVRRIQKKKIIPNTKVEYDEDGKQIKNKLSDSDESDNAVDGGRDSDDEKGTSGINIEKVREVLKKRDKKDKELYRQRVKQMHTEKRHKEKAKRREASKRGGVALEHDEDIDQNMGNDEEEEGNNSNTMMSNDDEDYNSD